MLHGGRRRPRIVQTLMCLGWTLAAVAASGRAGADDIFDASGFARNRDYFSQLPYEHIDPLTGNLILTFTDLFLPGNAGFDLRIQRTYNSKIYRNYDASGTTLGEDSWVGVGWTLHLGRVFNPHSTDPAPIIEMADGSRHKTYVHIQDSSKFVTRDFWLYDRNTNKLMLPNGLVYTFDKIVSLTGVTGQMRYATRIEDPFGNRVDVVYAAPSATAPEDGILSITQRFGTAAARVIMFTYDGTRKTINEMKFAGSTWTYTSVGTDSAGYSLLTVVRPPIGPSWGYSYRLPSDTRFKHELETVTTPQGGLITYGYDTVDFRLGTPDLITSVVVSSRRTHGRDVPDGTWSYLYAQGAQQNQTVIASPACSGSAPTTTTYTFEGVGAAATARAWRVGLQIARVLKEGAASLETETLAWRSSVPISNDNEQIGFSLDTEIYVPLLESRGILRGGANYTTTNTYGTANFNDYGRPYLVTENGQLTRITDRLFIYGFTPYIRDRVRSETVTVNGESFTQSHEYDASTGFMTSRTIHGIKTSYTPYTSGNAVGNVHRETNARGKQTAYSYDWGVPKTIQTPEYTITRVINVSGTIASETRRGFKTTYLYDGLFRLTDIVPHAGPPWTVSRPAPYPWQRRFDLSGQSVEVKRGADSLMSVRRTNVDGFGRASSTVNNVGIKTETQYDACGRVEYETYPFSSGDGSSVRTTFWYDGLNRLTRKTHPDNAFVRYDHSGINVDVTDEESRVTTQRWQAFGDPSDARLLSVEDAGSGPGGARTITSYAYNALGSLTEVNQPGASRRWAYNSRNQLELETHPESGRVDYTYDAVGNVATRTDHEFGRTSFIYDGNDRLLSIDRPGSAHDVTFHWDESDNRTLLENSATKSTFEYDPANRLTSRTDRINGQLPATFVTTYVPDRKDNIGEIKYPSGTRAIYGYDAENRLTFITGGGRTLAHGFAYHPSGGIVSYVAGNGLTHSTGYHPTRYWVNSINAGGQVTVAYTAFDKGGNVELASDSGVGPIDFGYDRVDRMTIADAPSAWGTGRFTYDRQGNRETSRVGSATTGYGYDTAKNRLASLSGGQVATFEYDDNGNLTRDNASTYTYTPANMLESATVAGSTTRYRYDGDNLRKLKVSGPTVGMYLHGPGDQILSELQQVSGGAILPVRDYVYAGTRLVAAIKPAVLVVNPEFRTFATVVGGPAPPSQTVAITEANGSSLAWTASESPEVSWMSLPGAVGGVISGTTPSALTISVDPAGLLVGSYLGKVTIFAPAVGSPKQVYVRLVVTNEAGLVVSPANLLFTTWAGSPSVSPQELELLNSSGGSSPWGIVPSEPWIQVSQPSGTTMPQRVSISVDPQGLEEGTYRGYLTVMAAGVPGSPRYVPVHLTVQPGAGAQCALESWYCEPFDGLAEGDIAGQGGWDATNVATGQVVADPRGLGQALRLDPFPGGQVNDDVGFADHLVNGTEISVQLMTEDVPIDSKQAAKLEFFTVAGTAWGKTFRTFGALRFGSVLYLQYGRNIYQVLIDSVQSGRWYSVKVRYQNQRIEAYVDGVLKYSTINPLAPDLPIQGFGITGWDVPGAAYIDLIQARPMPTGLVVDPLALKFRGTAGGGEARLHSPAASPIRTAQAETPRPTVAAVRAQLVQQPLAFEANRGQTQPEVRYLARGAGHTVSLTDDGLVMRLAGGRRGGNAGEATVVQMKLEGAVPSPRIEALELLPGRSNYLIGRDPRAWVTSVPRFGKVAYRDVYPDIDMVVYGKEGELEYDLVVRPGGDPSRIRMSMTGADRLRLDESGDVVLETRAGQVRQLKPRVYQERAGGRQEVSGGYVLAGSSVTFRFADYDRTLPLVVDPVISYSTYLEAPSGADFGRGIAVDPDGNAYVAGSTSGADFPTVNALQPTKPEGASELAFVVKLDPTGSVIYSTYLGGTSLSTRAFAVAADAAGNAYVVGDTGAPDFPVESPVQAQHGGGSPALDGFLAKLGPTGSSLVFSTYIGGTVHETAHDVALDAAGDVYVAGQTSSFTGMLCSVQNGQRVCPPSQKINADLGIGGSQWDVFVAKFGSASLAYLTYLNGNSNDTIPRIAVDGSGAVFVTGTTVSGPHSDPARNPFPASPGAFRTAASNSEAFVTKLAASGNSAVFSTYLGGVGNDYGNDIALEPGCSVDCAAYVTGTTSSSDFPTTPGVLWPAYGTGTSHGFVAKLNASASALVYSTYDGGTAFDNSIAVDVRGFAYVGGGGHEDLYTEALCGGTKVTATPTATLDGDAHVLKIDPTASSLAYCVFVGSSVNDSVSALALDPLGGVHITGNTGGLDFHTTPGAFQPAQEGRGIGAFVTKITEIEADVPRVQLDATAYEVQEDAGQAVIVVTRTGNLNKTVSVTYTVLGCRRPSRGNCRRGDLTAEEGEDFVQTSGTLTFGPDETALAFVVPIVDDATAEESETLRVRLVYPTDGAALNFPMTAIVTIHDDDGPTRTFVVKDRVLASGPNWHAEEDIPWLTLSHTDGVGPTTVTATRDTTGLSPGTYEGTIVVTGDTGDSPQFVEVTLTVTP